MNGKNKTKGFCLNIKMPEKPKFDSIKNGLKLLISHGEKTGTIPCVNFPPSLTCGNVPCSLICYACRANFTYANVQKAYIDNFNYAKNHMPEFFEHLQEYLNVYKPSYFRWFSSGDLISIKFFAMLVDLAKKNPHTKFLMFTKKYAFVNSFCDHNGGKKAIPKNLKIRFSAWDINFKVPNPYNFPIFYVNFKLNNEFGWQTPENARTATPCKGACQGCYLCWGDRDIVENQK